MHIHMNTQPRHSFTTFNLLQKGCATIQCEKKKEHSERNFNGKYNIFNLGVNYPLWSPISYLPNKKKSLTKPAISGESNTNLLCDFIFIFVVRFVSTFFPIVFCAAICWQNMLLNYYFFFVQLKCKRGFKRKKIFVEYICKLRQ